MVRTYLSELNCIELRKKIMKMYFITSSCYFLCNNVKKLKTEKMNDMKQQSTQIQESSVNVHHELDEYVKRCIDYLQTGMF